MRFTVNRALGVLLPAALLAATAQGQTPTEIRVGSGPYTFAPVIVANATTVPLTVVVRDRDGKVIPGLQEQRFRLTDDGRPQTLTSFRVETAPGRSGAVGRTSGAAAGAPGASASPAASGPAGVRYVALLFDDVNSSRSDLMQARNAAVRFMHEELGPGDRMAVFTVSSSQSLGFTRDRAALAKTIAEIAPHPRGGSVAGCPPITPYEAYLIAEEHDPMATGAVEALARSCAGGVMMGGGGLVTGATLEENADPVHMEAEGEWENTRGVTQDTLAAVRDVVDYTGKQPGQRIVVLASSGFLSGTLANQKDQIVRDALRESVTINALDAKGLYTEGPGLSLEEENDTGITQLPLVTYIFDEINKFPQAEAEDDAMASFAAATGGLFFKNNNDLTLGFRRLGLAPALSYEMAFTPTPMVRDGKLHKLEVKLAPPIQGATIEARRGYFAPAPGLNEQGVERALYQAMASTATASAVPAEVGVQPAAGELKVQVHFSVTAENEKLALVAGLFGTNGRYVSGERGEVDLALKSGTFKKLRKTGLAPTFALKAAAGKYRLRVVVLDEASRAVTEINRQVRIQ